MTENWNERFARAEAERRRLRDQQKAESGQKDMVRIGGNMSELPLPAHVFERLGGKPTRAEVEWMCAVCDETPPVRQYANGFVPGKCACQRKQVRLAAAEQERERVRLDRLEQWKVKQARERAQCGACYSWLGPDWSSLGMSDQTFMNFDTSFQFDGLTTAMEFADRPHGNLVLWSDVSWGTGKTHLAAAICNYRLAQGHPCRFTTAQNLFHAFGARMDSDHGYSDLLIQAANTPLLVLDDLDKAHQTAFTQKIFSEVLDLRHMRGLPTVITTNAHVELLHDDVMGLSGYIGRAAASRLCDRENGGVIVIEMNGEDYRRRERSST